MFLVPWGFFETLPFKGWKWNLKDYKLILNKCHISIPIKYKTCIKKFNLNNRKSSNILGSDKHLYVCNEDFNNTPYWINGNIDTISEITKYI